MSVSAITSLIVAPKKIAELLHFRDFSRLLSPRSDENI